MTDEVLTWDIASNNRYFVSGRGSLILNSIAALRALEAQDAELAAKTGLRPVPAGPVGRRAPYAVNVYMIWKFAENQEAAKRFLVDVTHESRASFLESQYLQIPSFPGAVDALADLTELHRAGKVKVLATSGAKRSTALPDVPTFTELGFPQIQDYTWVGFFAPAGTPPAVIGKLSGVVQSLLADAALMKSWADIGVSAYPPEERTPQGAQALFKREIARWSQVVREHHIQPVD
jgi:hypothetical protein